MFYYILYIFYFRVCNIIKMKSLVPIRSEVAFFQNFGNQHCAFYDIFIITT